MNPKPATFPPACSTNWAPAMAFGRRKGLIKKERKKEREEGRKGGTQTRATSRQDVVNNQNRSTLREGKKKKKK